MLLSCVINICVPKKKSEPSMDIIYRGEFLLKNKSFSIDENFGAIAN